MNSNPGSEKSVSQAAQAYANASVENAPPVRVVRLLYQGAIRFLDNAAACDPAAPATKFDAWLHRAMDVVLELRMSIEAAHAPELAGSLTELYLFVENAIRRARTERTIEPLAGARAVLAKLMEAWEAIETGKA